MEDNPMFRCRCVAWDTSGGWREDYHQRCPQRPTQEDGLCDHCRQTGRCADPECTDMNGTKGWGCCLQAYAHRAFTDQMTPCLAPRPITEEVPF